MLTLKGNYKIEYNISKTEASKKKIWYFEHLTNISTADHIDGPLAPKHLGVEREGRGLGCDRNFQLFVLFRPLQTRLFNLIN